MSPANQFSLLDCGVSSEPIFTTKLCVASKLVLLPNFYVNSEPGFTVELYVTSELGFAIEL